MPDPGREREQDDLAHYMARVSELRAELDAERARAERLQHIIDCADTPLMRDVQTKLRQAEQERDEAIANKGCCLDETCGAAVELAQAREALRKLREAGNALADFVVSEIGPDTGSEYAQPLDAWRALSASDEAALSAPAGEDDQ